MDPEFGLVTVPIWHQLRFRQALACWMQVAQVERPQALCTRRKPKIIWLAWVGETPLNAGRAAMPNVTPVIISIASPKGVFTGRSPNWLTPNKPSDGAI